MKKISFLLTMLVAVLLLASCSKQKSANLVPEDAAFVVRFDATQISTKSGLKDNNSELLEMIKEQLKNAGLDKDTRDKILSVVEDPTKSGIDFTEPMFLYVKLTKRMDAEAGLVGDMASESDLTNLLNTLTDEMGQDGVEKAKNGAKYVDMGNDVAFIFNDEWFFVGKASDIDDMAEELQGRADGKGSLQGNKAFETMCDKDGVMQFLMLYSGMANVPDMKEASDLLPEGLKLEDMAMVADLALTPGEALLTSEAVCLSKEWEKYMEKGNNALKAIGTEQTKYISDQGFSAFLNVDTKNLYEYVQSLMKSFDLGDEAEDVVKQICDALDGEASFDLYAIRDGEPQMALYVSTNNDTPLNMVVGNLAEVEDITEVGDNEYQIPTAYDYDWTDDDFVKTVKQWGLLGYKNGQSYFLTDMDNAFTKPAQAYPTNVIKGIGFFARFNFDFLDAIANETDNPNAEIISMVADAFDCIEMYYSKDYKFIVRWVCTDKKKNPVEVVFDMVKGFIN